MSGRSPSGTAGTSPNGTQAEAAVSNVTVTASSAGSNGGHATPGPHSLQAREQQPQPLDLMRRNPRPEPNMRPQPDRSRSRAKRRFSGSTANSSHSPGSERGAHQREREEGRQRDTSGGFGRGSDVSSVSAKPAPWGVIGVCALDVKARSKPSRNILNRLIAHREFDVVVFGDKVILDEGPSMSSSACKATSL